ncbi:hypothetical protein L208DRAFT_1265094 [Tricholoma matsutake]|nr:hypothetical protein L208DRAFT_1265094 [Tricholoma matsutake 945]
MCCHHCLETGGCQVKGHVVTGTLPPASNKGKQCAVAPDSPQGSHSSRCSRSPSPPAASTSTNLFADPWHASQLTAVFTKHYVTQHALEEQRRAADAEPLENIEKAKSHIIIYAWQKDDVEATVLEVQGGFKWPYFILSSVILSKVGLHHEDEQFKFRLYNTAVCTWTTVWIGHIITLTTSTDNTDGGPPAWPSAFYVVDIVHGFEKCEAAAQH